MQMEITKGVCLNCQKEFTYVRYRADKNYCSESCRGRQYYVTKGTHSQRGRRTKMSPEEWGAHRRQYEQEYLRRPEVKEKRRIAGRQRYGTEAYRLYSRSRYWDTVGSRHSDGPLPIGYTGHRWFELVRKQVGEPPTEGSLFFDRWADRMGTAVLALLEGRDIKEALDKHGKEEYIPTYRTSYLSDWTGENEYKQALIGSSPSAEDEAIKRQDTSIYLKTPFKGSSNSRRFGNAGSHGGKTAPTRRRAWKDHQDRPGHRRGQ